MTSQSFKTKDLLRLQVQDDWPDLPNLVLNPSGEGGAWGWTTDFGTLSGGPAGLFGVCSVAGDFGSYFTVNIDEVTGVGPQAKAWFTITDFDGDTRGIMGVTAWDEPDGPSGGGGGVPIDTTGWQTAPGTYSIDATALPVGTRSVSVTVQAAPSDFVPTAGDAMTFGDVILVVGTAGEIAATDPLTEPGWTDVLGSAYEISTDRSELNVGRLTAHIRNAALDPATNDLIRKGKRVRLQALVAAVWTTLFFGKIDDAEVTYELKDPSLPDAKRTRITLTAVDDDAELANDARPNGVGTINGLRAVLLGTGVPWKVNGSTAAVDPSTVPTVSVNPQASALDQIAITRDSVLGYAWVDREGTLQAWDAASLPGTVAATIDEDDYSDIDIGFDTKRCINAVLIKHVRINPGTGETEEATFGPYRDEESIRQWGRREATFTVHGIAESSLEAYAASILAANGTPARRVSGVVMPLRTVAEVEAKCLRDLYDLVTVSNSRAGLSSNIRITQVKHSITPTKWRVELGFAADDSVAPPQIVPAPVPLEGKTVAQLLRPVGEVTMWYGAKADIPAGWLPMDGSTVSDMATKYPDLYVLLGSSTTLPDFTDKFPIGAGTKALGTTGGASTVTLTTGNLPPHAHDMTHNHTLERSDAVGSTNANIPRGTATTASTGTGGIQQHSGNTGNGPGTSTPVNVLNPWRSLWFIIRAA